MHHAEVRKPLRQIAPSNPGTIAVEHRLHKQTVILSRPPNRTFTPRKQTFYPLPLIVPQCIPSDRHTYKLLKSAQIEYGEFDDTP
jgi:hypothetical protein